MKLKLSVLALALMVAGGAFAQNATNSKKDLVAQVLELQQGTLESLSRSLLQQTLMPTTQQVSVVLQQRVPADQRETVAKDVQAEMRKFFDESFPILRDSAGKAAQQTMGAILEERMTADELKQLVGALKSPALRKFQSLQGEMMRGFSEKLVADTRDQVQPKMQTMNQAIQQRLSPYLPAASAPR